MATMVRATAKDGTSPLTDDDTKNLLRLLRTFAPDGAPLDAKESLKSLLAKRTKTRDVVTQLWHGGGGFAIERIGAAISAGDSPAVAT